MFVAISLSVPLTRICSDAIDFQGRRQTRRASRACDRGSIIVRCGGFPHKPSQSQGTRPFHDTTTSAMSTSPPIFTATSAYSLAFVSAVGVAAYVASKSLLPKNASWQDRVTFIWLVSILALHVQLRQP